MPRSVAMKLTGHERESVYRRYAIVSEAEAEPWDGWSRCRDAPAIGGLELLRRPLDELSPPALERSSKGGDGPDRPSSADLVTVW